LDYNTQWKTAVSRPNQTTHNQARPWHLRRNRIDSPMHQDDREHLELEKLQNEGRKLRAEAQKFVAEARKLRQEAFWYPIATGSAVVTTIVGVMAVASKL